MERARSQRRREAHKEPKGWFEAWTCGAIFGCGGGTLCEEEEEEEAAATMIQATFRGHTVRTKHSMAVEVGYRRARRRAQAKALMDQNDEEGALAAHGPVRIKAVYGDGGAARRDGDYRSDGSIKAARRSVSKDLRMMHEKYRDVGVGMRYFEADMKENLEKAAAANANDRYTRDINEK